MRKINLDREFIKGFLWPLLVIMMVVILSFLVLAPQLSKTLELKSENTENREYLKKLLAKAQELEKFSSGDLERKLELSLKALPAKKELLLFLATVDKTAAENQVGIISFSSSPGETSAFPLNYTLSGSWENLGEFWKSLSESLPLFAVKRVKAINMAGQFTAEANLEAFILALPQKVGAVDSPLPTLAKEDEELFKTLEGFSSFNFSQNGQEASPSARANPFSF